MISFRLSKAAQLLLTLKGPGPGCGFVGRGQIAGRAGLNRFRYDGTVRGVRLEPGTYLVELRSRTGRRLARTLVTIVDPESLKEDFVLYAPPQCSAAELTALARPTSGATPALEEPVARVQSAPAAQSSGRPAEGKVSQVLGQVSPPGLGMPIIGDVDEGESVGFLDVLLLAIVLASLAAIVAAVFGSLRRGRAMI